MRIRRTFMTWGLQEDKLEGLYSQHPRQLTAHGGSKGPARFLPRSPGPSHPGAQGTPELSAYHTHSSVMQEPTLDVLPTGVSYGSKQEFLDVHFIL